MCTEKGLTVLPMFFLVTESTDMSYIMYKRPKFLRERPYFWTDFKILTPLGFRWVGELNKSACQDCGELKICPLLN